jgi:Icc-related predicted phosphoesterase
MQADGTLDDLFLRLMKERLAQWLTIADERLRPHGVPLYFMLGNDDPEELGELLDSAPWGTHCEGKVVWIDDDHEMISWGYSNTTPWHTYREETEPELATAIARSADQLTHPERAIFNLHAPPLATHLDDAPKLDADLQVQAVLGQVQYVPVGSSAVREAELAHQPLLGLHGHIHESPGIRRLGRTMIVNPGSDSGRCRQPPVQPGSKVAMCSSLWTSAPPAPAPPLSAWTAPGWRGANRAGTPFRSPPGLWQERSGRRLPAGSACRELSR